MNTKNGSGLMALSRRVLLAALSLALMSCSSLALVTLSATGHSSVPSSSGGTRASRDDRSSAAVAARTAFLAKDCAALKDGDVDELHDLRTEDRVQIAVKLVSCKRDVDLFEKIVVGASWDELVAKFPKDVDWLSRLESYVSTGTSRFPAYDEEGLETSLWIWVRIAKRDGTSARLCQAAFAHRRNLWALSAGAPVAFACANAGNDKAVAAVVAELLGSASWEARANGCDALAFAPQAATPKLARVVKEISYNDSHMAWIDDVPTYTVREKCAAASRKIELAQ